MPRRSATLACALTAGAVLLGAPAQATASGASPVRANAVRASAGRADAARTADSHFALSGSGYGTRLDGGSLTAGSGTTAYRRIGCTDRTGLDRTNTLATEDLPNVGTLSGLATRVWTTRHHGVVTSHARHHIAGLTLPATPAGSLVVTSITATVRAWHDASGFHAATRSTVGGVTLTPVVGPAVSLPVPTPGNPVTVPGVATLSLGTSSTRAGSVGAVASAAALRVDVSSTSTTAVLARAHATISGGVDFGLFHGHANATRVSAADSTLRSGPEPLSLMPCQGTHGRTRRRSVADAALAGGAVQVSGLVSRQRASQTGRRAHGYELAAVAHVDLGSGAVVVDGVVGEATVTRTAHGVRRSARGTGVGTVTVAGRTVAFPSSGIIDVPGVAELQRHLVHRSQSGLSVTALRITLLDGSGAVIDLGQARLSIARVRFAQR